MNLKIIFAAVCFLGALALVAVGGIIACAVTQVDTPAALPSLATGAMTGLVGLLVNPKPPA